VSRPAITTALMFEGRAEEAMGFYLDVFGDGEIEQIERYGAEEPGPEGTVKQAVVRLGDQWVRTMDSPVQHAFGFTPSVSLFVECETAGRVDEMSGRLLEGGSSLMPLDEYPFSPRYAWVTDRFGVSWQLYLAPIR
jgi:predicted 3-demethylubiquinone-9 3-methyltransferase (glyoxalase superfamily)